jgi:hypothetical protein
MLSNSFFDKGLLFAPVIAGIHQNIGISVGILALLNIKQNFYFTLLSNKYRDFTWVNLVLNGYKEKFSYHQDKKIVSKKKIQPNKLVTFKISINPHLKHFLK